MAFTKRISILASAVLALGVSQTSFAAPISGCANVGSPTLIGGVLSPAFTCSLYPTSPTYSINLTPYMTQGGAALVSNATGAGYTVILNGDPLAISANDTNDAALFNTSLWDAVLFFPNDQPANTSDALTIYYPGTFPSASLVKSVDEALYGTPDSIDFLAATPGFTVIGTGSPQLFDVYLSVPATATPEPNSAILLFTGILGLGFIAARKHLRPFVENN